MEYGGASQILRIDSANPYIVDIYLKNLKTFTRKDIFMHPYVHFGVIHGSQDMETSKVPFDGWLNKEDVVHVYSGALIGHRSDEILPFVTTWEYYAKWNKLDEKGQEAYEFSHMWAMSTYNKLIDTDNSRVVITGEGK